MISFPEKNNNIPPRYDNVGSKGSDFIAAKNELWRQQGEDFLNSRKIKSDSCWRVPVEWENMDTNEKAEPELISKVSELFKQMGVTATFVDGNQIENAMKLSEKEISWVQKNASIGKLTISLSIFNLNRKNTCMLTLQT